MLPKTRWSKGKPQQEYCMMMNVTAACRHNPMGNKKASVACYRNAGF